MIYNILYIYIIYIRVRARVCVCVCVYVIPVVSKARLNDQSSVMELLSNGRVCLIVLFTSFRLWLAQLWIISHYAINEERYRDYDRRPRHLTAGQHSVCHVWAVALCRDQLQAPKVVHDFELTFAFWIKQNQNSWRLIIIKISGDRYNKWMNELLNMQEVRRRGIACVQRQP